MALPQFLSTWRLSFLKNFIFAGCPFKLLSTVFTIVALISLLFFLALWLKSHKKFKMSLKNLWNFYRQFFLFLLKKAFKIKTLSLVLWKRLTSDSNGILTCNHLVRKWTLQHLANLAKWLSACLQTKWLWVRILLLSLKLQILLLFWVRSSLTFRELWSVDSLWNA